MPQTGEDFVDTRIPRARKRRRPHTKKGTRKMKSARRTPLPATPPEREPFGMTGWLRETQVALPLKGVECRFEVCGDMLDVEIDQIYHQSAKEPLDCMYSFPLPAGADVYRCQLYVNDRVIRARVEEAREARWDLQPEESGRQENGPGGSGTREPLHPLPGQSLAGRRGDGRRLAGRVPRLGWLRTGAGSCVTWPKISI